MLSVTELSTPFIGPLDLSVAAGECVTVQGPSGSGKSLMLRAIADLDPNRGDLRLGGDSREGLPAHEWRRRVAMVPAESGWWSDRVRDHFEPEGPQPALLEAVGLPEALSWKVSRLSTGERHRLAIIRALALEPEAILLDEPTATLDDAATRHVEALLRQQCARGAALLVVTHEAAQPGRLAARRLRMEAGRLSPLQGKARA